MREKLDLSMLGHVLLDSESHDRTGVEGSTFFKTFGVFIQFLNTKQDAPTQVQHLAQHIQELVHHETQIQTLSSQASIKSTKQQLQQRVFRGKKIKPDKLDRFIEKTQKEISSLPAGKKLLLPGGWLDKQDKGHAMIYEFERLENGNYLFSIVNSGAGIDRHDQSSSTDSEVFSPAKTYQIPSTASSTELKILLNRLIVPQLSKEHPKRKDRNWSEKELYNDIDISMVFLKANLLPKAIDDAKEKTAGQLAGTCAMRSIHQMLKYQFPTLIAYQQFIFEFKL